jgi:hypothetical protein
MTSLFEDIENPYDRYPEIIPPDSIFQFTYYRIIEILEYIRIHHIEDYIVLDDMDIRVGLENHFIYIKDGYFHQEYLKTALALLS